MPTGNDTLTVKKMKAEIAKKRQPKGTPAQPPEVVAQAPLQPVDNLYSQSDEVQPGEQKLTTSEGCTEHRNGYIKILNKVLHNQTNDFELLKYLIDCDMTPAMVELAVNDLTEAARREGVQPPGRLDWWINAIIEHRSDALTRHLEASTSPVKP